MLSKLRICGLRGRSRLAQETSTLPAPITLSVSRRALGDLAAWQRQVPGRLALQARAGQRQVQVRFCGGEPKKAPPKGFEKFYRPPQAKEAKGPEAEAQPKAEAQAKDSKGPAEGPAEGAKAEPDAKTGEAQAGEAKAAESQGPGAEGPKAEAKGRARDGKPKDGKGPPNSSQFNRQSLGVIAGAALFMMYMTWAEEEDHDEITIQEMMREYLMKGYVDKIQIVNKAYSRVHLRADAPGQYASKTFTIQLGTPEAFEAKLEQLQSELGLSPLDHVPIQYVNETSIMSELLPHLPSLLILIPLILAARAMSSGMGGMGAGGPGGPGGRNMFSMGKAFPQGQKDVKSKVRFKDVAGMEQAKREVVEFVDFLKNPAKYEALGARVPKGGLLVGPPGTGKTLLAKAVAGEADCPFYSISGSDFVEMFVGVGPSRVRDLFQQARTSAPSIIFIDEIDAVGRKRGKGGFGGGGNDERENTLNQMLVEMDGFNSSSGVVVLAGTNRADVLDPALLRPGRFDRQIAIDKPDLSERQAIFLVHLQPVKLDANVKIEDVAKRMASLTPGFAGADIANICNEAAIFAARRSGKSIEMDDFERATERVLGGLEKHNSLMSKEEKHVVALHEAGHAVAGWYLQYSDPLLKVSIVPRASGALGFAQYLPDEVSLFSKEAILDKIAVALGGRAAEEIFVGKISTGASDDLDKVTKMAYSMVTVYGMNDALGLLSYNQNSGEQFYKPYSEETGQLIDRQARSIVDEQYERVKVLLTEKTDVMKALADRLDEKETIVYNELREILGERPHGMKEEFREFVTAGSIHDSDRPKTSEAPSDAPAESADPGAESKDSDAAPKDAADSGAAPKEGGGGRQSPAP